MFYSHEILTSRKYGVATVWLVATLGSKSTSKKVNKKAILEVDIPKACNVIIEPEAPMALRLQSNLLCGVTRVYSQQCGYALVDAQNIQSQMRQLIRSVRQAGQDLDLELGRGARPDQLLLPDDPNLLMDMSLDVDLDLGTLNLDTQASSQSTSVLSPRSRRSSQTSLDERDLPALEIPSSSGGVGGGGSGFGRFELGDDVSNLRGSLQDQQGNLHFPAEPDETILEGPEFGFDQDGNLFDYDDPTQLARSSLPVPMPTRAESVASVQARQRSELDLPQDFNQDVEPMDLDDIPIEGRQPLPAAEPSPPLERQDSAVHLSTETLEEAGSSYGAKAPMARKKSSRQKHPLALDKVLEIRNIELLSWSTNYQANMAEVRKKKATTKKINDSKKNAEWFVWGAGLGGIGYEVRAMNGIKHPLDIFCGDKLKELLLGSASAGRKHDREEDSTEEGSESRRVRPRSEEHGRGEEEELGTFAEGGEYDEPPEIGRRAPTPSHGPPSTDASSTMPWNVAGPFHSSQIGRGPGLRMRSNSRTPAIGSLQQRSRAPGSRLTSASPLHGRGKPHSRDISRHSSLALPGGLTSGPGGSSSARGGGGDLGPQISDDLAIYDEDNVGLPDNAQLDLQEDFEGLGAAPAADTQTTQTDSQWVRRQLDAESGNFLAFVVAAGDEHAEDTEMIDAHAAIDAVGEADAQKKKGIAFETLLKPVENTYVVAAQGLLHVLTLAMRDLLWVEQNEETFGGEMIVGATAKGVDFVAANAAVVEAGEDELAEEA